MFVNFCYFSNHKLAANKNWKLYNYFRFKALSLPLDSIKQYQLISLNDIQIRRMLLDAEIMNGPTKNIQWMGLHTVTHQYQNKERKMEVSYYGGFVYDDTTKSYYEVNENVRDEWQNYFTNFDVSSFNNPPSKEIR